MYEIFSIRPPEGPALYAISNADNGHAFTPVREAEVHGSLADGTRVTLEPTQRPGWYTAVPGLAAVEIVTPHVPTTVRWVLRDPATVSARFPQELSPEEYRNSDEEEELLYSLYRAETEPTPATVTRVDGPFQTLEGREPPGPDEPDWTANLPDLIRGRQEYAHLYPGHISGLRDHVHKLIKAMPHVSFAATNYDGYRGISVAVSVPYAPDITRWRANVGSRGQTLRTGRTVSETHVRHLRLPVPDRVTGDNYADALAQWDQAVEFWTALVRDASVTACGHCKGTGVVEDGAVSYEKGN